MEKVIRFGTDGWRAIIADQFTFENVRIIAQAVADYVSYTHHHTKKLVVIGYDTRFMSGRFATLFAEVLASNRLKILFANHYIPTPVLSYSVNKNNADAGIMITASHNTGEYNGIKFKGAYGGSATTEITTGIEKLLYKTQPQLNPDLIKNNLNPVDLLTSYQKQICSLVDIDRIRKLNLVIDSMHGAGGKLLEELLKKSYNKILTIRANPDPLFEGHHPEPIQSNLQDLVNEIKNRESDIGIATDGDADRMGIIAPDGMFIIPPKIMALLIIHLIKNKKWTGDIVKTTSVSQLVDNVCAKYGLKLHYTKVGFKYICEVMLKANVMLGGEESGGIGFSKHIPERDGILTSLLLLEYLATEKKSLVQLLHELENEFGKFAYLREDLYYPYPDRLEIIPRLLANPPAIVGDSKVKEISGFDGIKFFFTDGGWLLIRASNTEPVIRIYTESLTVNKVQKQLNSMKKIILGKD